MNNKTIFELNFFNNKEIKEISKDQLSHLHVIILGLIQQCVL